MEKMYEDIKKGFESKGLLKILYAIGILLAAMFIFYLGIMVGFHKASFGEAWGDHYNENFGMGRQNISMGGIQTPVMTDNFPNAHGAIGEIIKTEFPNIIVQGKDNIEKAILISSDTKIQNAGTTITMNDLKINDFVVVIGTPDTNGLIEAKLIRVIPSPEFLK